MGEPYSSIIVIMNSETRYSLKDLSNSKLQNRPKCTCRSNFVETVIFGGILVGSAVILNGLIGRPIMKLYGIYNAANAKAIKDLGAKTAAK